MCSRFAMASLSLGSLLVLLGVGLAECQGQTGKLFAKETPVVALLQVSMQPDALTGPAAGRNAAGEFTIFKHTQAQLLKSPFVLTAALRKPEITSLGIYKRHQDNPVDWLQKALVVTFPGDAEIMRVSLADSNPEEAAKVVQAVVDAYLNQVVQTASNTRARQLAEIEGLLASKEREIRQRRTTLKTLAEELGTVDKDTLRLELQFATQELAGLRRQMAHVGSELRKLTADRAVKQAALKRLDKTDPAASPADGQTDGTSQLRRIARGLSALLDELDKTAGSLPKDNQATQLQDDVKDMRRELRRWQRELDTHRHKARRAKLQEQIADIEVKIRLAEEAMAESREEIDRRRKTFEKIGQSSVDLEMMRADLKNLETVLSEIVRQREKLLIESKSQPRIRLLQRAEAPK